MEDLLIVTIGKMIMFLCCFLASFYDITLKFSGSMYITSNLYFYEMCSIHSDLTSLSPVVSKMAKSMKNKYDKYWGSINSLNNLLLI